MRATRIRSDEWNLESTPWDPAPRKSTGKASTANKFDKGVVTVDFGRRAARLAA